VKRLLALVAGGLGLRAFWKRRSRPALTPAPAEELRAKLAQTKSQDAPAETVPEPEPEPEPAQPEAVEDRRADVHAKARQAIDDLGKS
jgi:hypothetical protein